MFTVGIFIPYTVFFSVISLSDKYLFTPLLILTNLISNTLPNENFTRISIWIQNHFEALYISM
jgi:hypothetical protein